MLGSVIVRNTLWTRASNGRVCRYLGLEMNYELATGTKSMYFFDFLVLRDGMVGLRPAKSRAVRCVEERLQNMFSVKAAFGEPFIESLQNPGGVPLGSTVVKRLHNVSKERWWGSEAWVLKSRIESRVGI